MSYNAIGIPAQLMSAQEAQGKDTNSIMQGWIDRGPWQYWDTIPWTAGTVLSNGYSPFSVPIGQQDPLVAGTTKTKLSTNMQRGNQFPPPRCLVLMALEFYFSSTCLKSDIDAWLDGCYATFKIDDKVFHEGLLYFFPSGMGLNGVTTNNGESVYTNGFPSPQFSRRYAEWSKYIAPLQQFSLDITFPGTPPTMTNAGQIKIVLDGLTDRSVQ